MSEQNADAQWREALKRYGFDTEGTPEEVVKKAAEAFQQRDWRWREEIEKYFPQIGVMSFCGPVSTIRWLMGRMTMHPDDKALADRLTAIRNDLTLTDSEKADKRLTSIFPNLRGDSDGPGREESQREGGGGVDPGPQTG